ncbi:MAG: RHS repeat-associated core domain-containing protein [Pyrinomonadaceae bacterium]
MSTIELDPWGADTSRSNNAAFQPKKFTSYERDANGSDEAMFRRYTRGHSRFDQPDPYDGSYDFSNPQSLNRYAYVQNDPVNFVDPSGLCTFNFNVTNGAGLSNGQLGIMQNEIQRIFGAAGQSVVFNNAGAANGGSFNLTVQQAGNPARIAQGTVAPGWTDLNLAGNAVTNNGFASTQVLANAIQSGLTSNPSLQALGRHPDNFAVGLGRVGAHEAGHFFLQMPGHSSDGLMRTGFTGAQWFQAAYNNNFRFTTQQVAQLFRLCPQLLDAPTVVPGNSPMMRPLIGGGGGGGGGGGFGGYPSWWYSLWAFVDWVRSIELRGPDPEDDHLG